MSNEQTDQRRELEAQGLQDLEPTGNEVTEIKGGDGTTTTTTPPPYARKHLAGVKYED